MALNPLECNHLASVGLKGLPSPGHTVLHRICCLPNDVHSS